MYIYIYIYINIYIYKYVYVYVYMIYTYTYYSCYYIHTYMKPKPLTREHKSLRALLVYQALSY